MASAPEKGPEVASGKPAARRFSFASAVLDERTLELLVQNQPVELEPKPLEVLRHLLFHAGEVVTKDEILAAVWPGRILSETVLTKCIARLREVLNDDDQQVIKTVHGYGYRLVAPVSVEASVSAAAPPPHFDFKPGDHPPLRPLWSLVQRLGQGSHGEAWLVRHDKTREQRVYKFAPDTGALHALKREITLYRLLHDALGDQAPSVAALDWNLDESPYFLEIEYASGGSLVDWALAQNGLGQVPLPVRLEIAAQIAEALGAAHSMGVLHKDLKPSNVLIVSAPGEPISVKLGDFGSGGVLEPGRLEAMGITRMGFTQTIKAGTIGGTPLYLAPEVIAGQPATIQADIYALGVILYQLIVGDLWRPLAPGWEQDIADELLREDIAFAAEGHVARRLGTAALLAQRLRTLEQRRQKRAAEQAVQSEVERARQAMERMRARRGWVLAIVVVLVIGLAATTTLYFKAQRAAETTQAVSDFLNNDVLSSADPWKNPTKSMTIKDALDRAAIEVPKRFSDRPEVAARLHATIGETYMRMEQSQPAREHLTQAAALYADLYGSDSEQRLSVLKSLGDTLIDLSLDQEACAAYQEVLENRQRQFGAGEPKMLSSRLDMAICHAHLGDMGAATEEIGGVLKEAQHANALDQEFVIRAKTLLAQGLPQIGRLDESEKLHREVLDYLIAKYGPRHLRAALQRQNLALVLDYQARYDEEAIELEQGLRDLHDWAGDTDAYTISFSWALANVRIRQDRAGEAVTLLEDALNRSRSLYGSEHENLALIPATLASAYRKQGRFKEAVQILRPALALSEKRFGADHPSSLDLRIRLVGALRDQGDHAGAWVMLKAASPKAIATLPPQHHLLGGYYREQGLLWLHENRNDRARDALERSLSIFEQALGPKHPNTTAVRDQLAKVPKS